MANGENYTQFSVSWDKINSRDNTLSNLKGGTIPV